MLVDLSGFWFPTSLSDPKTGGSLDQQLFDYAVEKLAIARQHAHIDCKICCGASPLFDIVDFNKTCHPNIYPNGLEVVPVTYRRCSSCAFIFTDFFDEFSPEYWRRYVYNERYADVDPDYIAIRPLGNAREVYSFFSGNSDGVVGLDYGGGNGLTASLLRDCGWTYDSYDPFGHTDVLPERIGHYNFCSSFEVFEHSPDPKGSLKELLEHLQTDKFIIYIGTAVHDRFVSDERRLSWWYAGPRNGHISLYSRKSLHVLASQFGLTYHPMAIIPGTHIFTRGFTVKEIIMMLLRGKINRRLRSMVGGWPRSIT